jgi:hypothetical protein
MSSLSKIKGQGIIGEIIIFSIVIFFSIAIFMLLSIDDSQFQQEADLTIERQMGMVHHRSALTEALNDRVGILQEKASPPSEIRGKNYENLTAIKMTSYYLSTEESENFHIKGEEHERDEIKTVLNKYYDFKFSGSYEGNTEYRFLTWYDTENGNRREIRVKNYNSKPSDMTNIKVPLQLSSDRTGSIKLDVFSPGGVFSVE